MREQIGSREVAVTQIDRFAPTSVRAIAAVLVIVAILDAVSISVFPLSEPDETRYALIAREMVATGDWITPRVGGSPFYDKPPLLFWATAAAFELGGVNLVAARLPVVLSALGCLLVTWRLGRRMVGRRAACLAVLILGTSPLFFALGQHLMLDMPLTFFVTAALASVWFGLRDGSRRWVIVAWMCLGFGVLTKGPVAVVLVGGSVTTYLVTLQDRSAVRRLLDPVGVAVASVVAVPWFLLVESQTSGYLEIFFFRHHLQRFLEPWHHQEPWWYLLAVIPMAMFPWSVLAAVCGWAGGCVSRPSKWSPEIRFLVIWAGWTVLFFSLSSSKIVTYILPALPALALLFARGMVTCTNGLRRALGVTGAVTACGGFVLGIVIVHEFPELYHDHGSAATAIGVACAGVLLIAGLGAMLLTRLELHRDALVTMFVGTTLLLACAVAGRQFATSYEDLGAVVEAALESEDTVVMYDEAVYGIALEAGVEPVFVPSRRHRDPVERESLWGDRDTEWLVRRWGSGDRLFVVLDDRDLSDLASRLEPSPTVLARSKGKVVVVNFEPTPAGGLPRQSARTPSTRSTR